MGWWALRYGDGYIETLIIYGLVNDPSALAKKILLLQDGTSTQLSNQHAFFNENSPALRLNCSDWLQHSSNAIEVNNSELLYNMTIEKIMRNILPFSYLTRIFIKSYFDFMLEQTKKIFINEAELEIFNQQDWVYSAWLPMPNTHILLSPEFNNEKFEFVEFDLSFWTEGQLICIQLGQPNTLIKSKMEKRKQLEFAYPYINIIEIPINRFTENEKLFPSDLFSENFNYFWRGLKLPKGPNTQPILEFNS